VRDWGYAPEYVEAMWLILQRDVPCDLVIGTGTAYTIRQFAEMAFAVVGIELGWSGQGADERGRDRRTGAVRVAVDPVYFRPLETERLRADPRLAERTLGWRARTLAPALARLMVRYDIVHDEFGFPDLVDDADVARRMEGRT